MDFQRTERWMTAAPQAALRPMLPTEGPALAALFQASVLALTADDYDEDQREAWAAQADDGAAFGTRLAGQLTLVATMEGAPVGFASLAGADKIAMLYVAPERARIGIASLLLDALVRLAGARGAKTLTVDASDTARDFFAARGFTATMRNVVPCGDAWLANTTMECGLASAAPVRPQ